MTTERREPAPRDLASGPENPPTASPFTTDLTLEFAAGPKPSGPASVPPTAFGRYQVRRVLGAGGFGAVYLGHDTQLNRPVARKVLRARPGLAQGADGPGLQVAG